MTQSLAGKTALITGSGRGLGRSHAVTLARRGADIVVLDVIGDNARETARLVKAEGQKAETLVVDVCDVPALKAAIAGADRAVGGIDILVNNAGVGTEGLTFENTDVAAFDRMFNTQVRGAFFTTQAVIPSMKERRGGRIVNTTSTFALIGHHFGSHYAAAKAALAGLTKSWAREFAPFGITVNAVAPGVIVTDMTMGALGEDGIAAMEREVPLGRVAEQVEISYAVAWLASDEAAMMTGQTISPSGGVVIT